LSNTLVYGSFRIRKEGRFGLDDEGRHYASREELMDTIKIPKNPIGQATCYEVVSSPVALV
jgi:hypothetical protein